MTLSQQIQAFLDDIKRHDEIMDPAPWGLFCDMPNDELGESKTKAAAYSKVGPIKSCDGCNIGNAANMEGMAFFRTALPKAGEVIRYVIDYVSATWPPEERRTLEEKIVRILEDGSTQDNQKVTDGGQE